MIPKYLLFATMEAEKEKSGVTVFGPDNNIKVASEAVFGSDFSVGKKRLVVVPFVRKTYDMVNDPKIDSIISWSSDGSRLVVWDAHRFAVEILPIYFRHNNFSSFVCQLNTYGFKKVDWDKWEFQHPLFQKGKKSWLKKITRRTPKRLRLARIGPLQEQQQQLPRNEDMISVEAEKEIQEMLDEQNAMRTEIKQLQEEQANLAKKLAIIKKQAESPDVKGRELFLLMAQDFLQHRRGLERKERDENNEKSPHAPPEKENNNVLAQSDANSRSENHTRLEKLVEEVPDIMIPLEDLIEGLADWEDYVKKL